MGAAEGDSQTDNDSAPLDEGGPQPIRDDDLTGFRCGRLAVDRRYHRKGIAAGLLKDAVLRTRAASRHVGIRALLVHAIDEDAVRFYERYGFRSSPIDPTTLMVH